MSTEKYESVNRCLEQIKKEQSMERVEELYDIMSPTIRHIALKYLHSDDMADEFIQDFWADIYKIASGFRFSRNGYYYLCKVATNRAINAYRKASDRRAYVSYVEYIDYQFEDTAEDAEKREIQLMVCQAMKGLSEIERIIIQSAYFEEKTVRQIAAELKMSKSSVGRLKLQAIEKLKSLLVE